MPYALLSLPFRRALTALAALALPALLIGAVAPNATEVPTAPAHPSLAGQLLVATPEMRDPRFDHAVILVVRHDQSGALGIVINMPVGERPIAELLAAIGEKSDASGTVPVYLGGPVEPEEESQKQMSSGVVAAGRASVAAPARSSAKRRQPEMASPDTTTWRSAGCPARTPLSLPWRASETTRARARLSRSRKS